MAYKVKCRVKLTLSLGLTSLWSSLGKIQIDRWVCWGERQTTMSHNYLSYVLAQSKSRWSTALARLSSNMLCFPHLQWVHLQWHLCFILSKMQKSVLSVHLTDMLVSVSCIKQTNKQKMKSNNFSYNTCVLRQTWYMSAFFPRTASMNMGFLHCM